MVFEHTPALIKKFAKRPKFYFATQVSAMPPTIVVFCNVSEEIQPSYKRYMNHKFRKYLAYNTIPLQLVFRDKEAVRARKEDEESYHNYRASLSEEAQESTPQI
jgi:predicted GTPase